jgi:hypothetical protein
MERKNKAKQDLQAACENYFAALDSHADIDLAALAKLAKLYAREIYYSEVEAYVGPSSDTESLFGAEGILNIGPTLAEVERTLSTLRIERPLRIRSTDPVIKMFDDGHELVGVHFEHPWIRSEIGDTLRECVANARLRYKASTTAAEEGSIAEGTNPAKSNMESRRRGRPQKISDERKAEAEALKDSGGTNRDAAAKLYGTSYPTVQQVKNVCSILREYRKKKSKTGWSVNPERTEAP